MEWFEPLIALGAIVLVALPFIISKHNKKQGKSSCGHECSCCSSHEACAKRFKKNIEEYRKNKKLTAM